MIRSVQPNLTTNATLTNSCFRCNTLSPQRPWPEHVSDSQGDKLPEAWTVGRLDAFWVPLVPNLGSPARSQAVSCSCFLLPLGMLSNSIFIPPSVPSPGPVLISLLFPRGLSCISQLLRKKNPGPLRPLRFPE